MSENVGSHVCHLSVLPATCTAIYLQTSLRWHSNIQREHSVVFGVTLYLVNTLDTSLLYYGKRYEL